MFACEVKLGQTFVIIGGKTEDRYTRVEPVFETEDTFVALSRNTMHRIIFSSENVDVKLVK